MITIILIIIIFTREVVDALEGEPALLVFDLQVCKKSKESNNPSIPQEREILNSLKIVTFRPIVAPINLCRW
jgi:hypothetical protein